MQVKRTSTTAAATRGKLLEGRGGKGGETVEGKKRVCVREVMDGRVR